MFIPAKRSACEYKTPLYTGRQNMKLYAGGRSRKLRQRLMMPHREYSIMRTSARAAMCRARYPVPKAAAAPATEITPDQTI